MKLFILAALILVLGLGSCFNKERVDRKKSEQDSLMNFESEEPFITGIPQDSLISFLSNAKEVSVNRNANRPFNKIKYNKVIAYEYQGSNGENVLRIINNGKLANTIRKQKELNQLQVNQLTSFLSATSTYGNAKAFCFEPHLAVVFFMDEKVVLDISISLECNFLQSSIPIPATIRNGLK